MVNIKKIIITIITQYQKNQVEKWSIKNEIKQKKNKHKCIEIQFDYKIFKIKKK